MKKLLDAYETLIMDVNAIEDIHSLDNKTQNKKYEELEKLFSSVISNKLSPDKIKNVFDTLAEKLDARFIKIMFKSYAKINKDCYIYARECILDLCEYYFEKLSVKDKFDRKNVVEYIRTKKLNYVKNNVDMFNDILQKENTLNLKPDDIIALIFLWTYCSIDIVNPADCINLKTYISRGIIEYKTIINGKSLNKALNTEIIKAVYCKDKISRFVSMCYLYYNMPARIKALNIKNDELTEQKNYLIAKNKEQSENIKADKLRLTELMNKCNDLEKENSELHQNNYEIENRLEYEVNKYEKQNETFKKAFIQKLNNDINLELDGIFTIMGNIQERDKVRLERRLMRIKRILMKAEEEK